MRFRISLFAIVAALSVRAVAAPIAGIDHMPFAVRDLDRAEATFRELGFAIKPGRPHDNGIHTALVKFPDGSGIELITAKSPVDDLTRRYVELLRQGEGPGFFALHVRDPKASRRGVEGGAGALRRSRRRPGDPAAASTGCSSSATTDRPRIVPNTSRTRMARRRCRAYGWRLTIRSPCAVC